MTIEMFIDELRRLEQAATGGKWQAHFTTHGDPFVIGSEVAALRPGGEPSFPQDLRATVSTTSGDYGRADAELIAAARNAFPALLDVVEVASELLAVLDGEEADLSSCSYFRGEGLCSFGCSQEPVCVTGIPSGGWPSDRARAVLARLEEYQHER